MMLFQLRSALVIAASCLATWLCATPSWADAPKDESEEGARQDDSAHDPMNWLGLSLKAGYSHQNPGVIDNPIYSQTIADAAAMVPPETLQATGLVGGGGCSVIDRKCRTAERSGFQLSATLHVGGDGFGWDFEPYMMWSDAATALGMYTGPKFDIHLAAPLYFGFGFGFKAAYVWADGWEHAADIAGRIPVHFTFYALRNLAFTVEGAFGAGVSGYLLENQRVTNPLTGQPIGNVPKMSFGAARVWDISAGIRFP